MKSEVAIAIVTSLAACMDAEYLANACIATMRYSPCLRQQRDDVHSLE
ncbi:hypothetical protein [Paraburkholderia sp. BCC1884]|nr:hypothetical protein [Paraburkholderia sp. BCC1884]